MYLPEQFSESNPELQQQLMRAYPLATLVVAVDGRPMANHLPLLFRAKAGADNGVGVLQGHVPRANPLWQVAAAGTPALAIFQGPQSYITPAWYPGKPVHGKVVPTWNYVVVQASGSLRAVSDPAWIRRQVVALTDQQEQTRPDPWAVADAPEQFTAQMIDALMGIELVIESLTGKWKVSQNRPLADQHAVADGLGNAAAAEAQAMADLVRRGISTNE